MENNFIGEKLKKLRLQKKLKINSVCDILKSLNMPISIKTIYRWESGETIPDLQYLNAITSIYDTNIATLFDEQIECQALDIMETEFINTIRNNDTYKKIISLILKNDKEEYRYANKVII